MIVIKKPTYLKTLKYLFLQKKSFIKCVAFKDSIRNIINAVIVISQGISKKSTMANKILWDNKSNLLRNS